MTGIVLVFIGIGCVSISLIGLIITAFAFPASRKKRIAKITDF